MKIDIGPYPENKKEPRHISIEIHDYDHWDLNQTLALVISAALQNLKARGFPTEFDEETGLKQWQDMIDQMAWSFKEIAEYYPQKPSLETPTDLVFDLKAWCDWNPEGKESWKESWDIYHAKIQHGLELFGKYFEHLWD